MLQYRAPIRDIQFALHELLNVEAHYASIPAYTEATRELVDSIIEAGAKFAEEELSPLNRIGDEEGCRLENGHVSTPRDSRRPMPTMFPWDMAPLPRRLNMVVKACRHRWALSSVK